MRYYQFVMILIGGLVGFSHFGCEMKPSASSPTKTAGQDHGHDHDHDHPTSLVDAIKLVDKFKLEIKAAHTNKKPEEAHGALHEVAHALESVESLALAAATTDESKAAAKTAIKDLFDAFGAMDDVHHGKEGKSYDDVSAKIDAALAALQAMVKP